MWLPFSLYFLSLFLSNVAQAYKRLNAKHVLNIELKLRKQSKNTDQVIAPTITVGESNISDYDSLDQYDTMRSYLEKVKKDLLDNHVKYSKDSPQDASTYDISQLTKSTRRRLSFFGALPRNKFKSASVLFFEAKGRMNNNEKNKCQEGMESDTKKDCSIKARFSNNLRVLVQERIALIILHEILLIEGCIDVAVTKRHGVVQVIFPNMKQIAEKWLIPRRARESFAIVTMNLLIGLGKEAIKSGQLFELSPSTFHQLFLPMMAEMMDSDISETWQASTEVLAEEMGWNEDLELEDQVESFAVQFKQILGSVFL